MRSVFKSLFQSSAVLTLILFSCGFFLRAYRFDLYPLQFDQVQLLTNAQEIQTGDLKLIGPRTGPAEMFTGPLVYYLTAFLALIIAPPWTVIAMAITFYFITFWAMRFLFLFYKVDKRIQFFFLLFYAVSLYQVTLDRIPWNPNLMLLASILVFLPMQEVVSSRLIRKWDALFLSIGIFLGYQAHFSGLFLLLFVLGFLFFPLKNKYLAVVAAVSGIVSTLLPTLVFDLKHGWINLNGLIQMAQEQSTPSTQNEFFLVRLFKDIIISMENIGKFFVPHTEIYLAAAIGVLLVLWYGNYARFQKNQRVVWLPLAWFFVINLLFLPYKGPKPEYYFLIQFPAILWMIGTLLSQIKIPVSKLLFGIVFGFSAIHFIGLLHELHKRTGLTIGNQTQAAAIIKKRFQENSNLLIAYDIEQVERAGFEYLLHDYPEVVTAKETQNVVHLIYPADERTPTTVSLGKLVIWDDPRTELNRRYLLRQDVVISSQQSIELYKDLYPPKQFDMASDQFILLRNELIIGKLFAFDEEVKNARRKDFFKQFEEEWDKTINGWQSLVYQDKTIYLQHKNTTTFLLLIETTDKSIISDLLSITLHP